MSKFSKNNNNGAIEHEVNYLIEVMKQKEMRRYKNFLFSMYNHHKIYVSVREFVWTHIRTPYLAESTCDVFLDRLKELEKEQIVTVIVTDMALLNKRPTQIELNVSLDRGIAAVNWLVNQIYEDDEAWMKPKKVSYRYRHPEDPRGLHKVKREDLSKYSLGDFGFTDGSKVYIYPYNMVE